MKYIKTFENNIFGSTQYSYWFIKGKEHEVRHILMKLYEDKNYSEYKNSLENIVTDLFKNSVKYEDIYGVLLFLVLNKKWEFSLQYYPVTKQKYDYIKNTTDFYLFGAPFSKYRYQGEIKLENDKIEVDTLEIDIEKYNL